MKNEKKLSHPFQVITQMNDYIDKNESKFVENCISYLDTLSSRKFYIENLTELQKQQIQQSIQNGKNYLNQIN